jgi:hypothetical protein
MLSLKYAFSFGLVALHHVVDAETVPLPPPTGQYNIGVSKHTIPFYSENDPTSPSGVQTEFLATLYYPTLDKPCKPVPYLDPGLTEIISGVLNAGPDTLNSLTALVKHNASFLPGPVGESPYPTILFGPGGTGPPTECYLTLIGELVSHGYTVAALDHTYEQPFVRFPNGTGVVGVPVDFAPTPEEVLRIAEMRVADNLHFLSIWPDLVKELGAPFSVTNFGAFGHSLGGAASFETATVSDLVHAAFNMDGANFGRPGLNNSQADVGKPVIQFGQTAHTPALDETWGTFPIWQTGWWRTMLVNGTEVSSKIDPRILKK